MLEQTIEEYLDSYTDEGCPEPADVQEVKHAHWEFSYENGWKLCSACKAGALCDRGSYSEHLSKYCPNCGARMDEEENE